MEGNRREKLGGGEEMERQGGKTWGEMAMNKLFTRIFFALVLID